MSTASVDTLGAAIRETLLAWNDAGQTLQAFLEATRPAGEAARILQTLDAIGAAAGEVGDARAAGQTRLSWLREVARRCGVEDAALGPLQPVLDGLLGNLGAGLGASVGFDFGDLGDLAVIEDWLSGPAGGPAMRTLAALIAGPLRDFAAEQGLDAPIEVAAAAASLGLATTRIAIAVATGELSFDEGLARLQDQATASIATLLRLGIVEGAALGGASIGSAIGGLMGMAPVGAQLGRALGRAGGRMAADALEPVLQRLTKALAAGAREAGSTLLDLGRALLGGLGA